MGEAELVAERHLTLRTEDGERTIIIRVFAPERSDGDWACRYGIDWPHEPRSFQAHGVDAMQALQLALNMIAAEIYCSPYHQSGALFWERPGGGYGFPVPHGLRDLAVGDDVPSA
jgi:hypothetical protein